MPVDVDPFGGPQGDLFAERVGVRVLDHMQVLDAQEVARAHHRTGVVRLVDVFQHHGEMARSLARDAIEKRAAFRGDEPAEFFVEPRVGHGRGMSKNEKVPR